MALTVDVQEAKTQLDESLSRVSMGEEVIIAEAGKSVARLVSAVERPAERVPGTAKGKIVIAPDFDAPLPPEILEAFYK